jgi:hypothetical protein
MRHPNGFGLEACLNTPKPEQIRRSIGKLLSASTSDPLD